MGVVLSVRLAASLQAAGLNPAAVSLDSLLDPVAGASAAASLEGTLRTALAGAMQGVFLIAFVAAAIGLLATGFAPRGRIAQLAARAPAPEGESASQSIGLIE